MREIEQFERNWKKFTEVIHGKMLTRPAKSELTPRVANLMLSDALGTWSSEVDESGRWLLAVMQTDMRKGKEIEKIFLDEMHFKKRKNIKRIPKAVLYSVPVLFAAAGFFIARIFTETVWIQALAVCLPLLIVYLVLIGLTKGLQEAGKEMMIEDYMDQLSTYRKEIIQILEA